MIRSSRYRIKGTWKGYGLRYTTVKNTTHRFRNTLLHLGTIKNIYASDRSGVEKILWRNVFCFTSDVDSRVNFCEL